MTNRRTVSTVHAPRAIGTYSQAVRCGETVYISGQIPLDPATQEVVEGDARVQITRVFKNVAAVAEAAGGSLDDIAKLTVYLVDLGNFPIVNEVMSEYFEEPYPARAVIGVASLPKGVAVEVEAVMAFQE